MNYPSLRPTRFLSVVFFLSLLFLSNLAAESSSEKTRLIIMADMGNESDEEQQMIHMLMYANMFDLEGLIACSGFFLHSGVDNDYRSKVHPELFTKLINGYAHIVENLRKHDSGWPASGALHQIVRSGTSVFGLEAVGEGNSNEASRLIEQAILKDDPRKLYIVANAGTNTLAQALVDLKSRHTPEEMEALCKRIIVFENGAQDNCGAWIASKFPAIAWYRSNDQTYCYGGPDYGKFGIALGPYTWEPYPRHSDGQDEWATEHIKENHGWLGSLYPYRNRFIEGGGTIPWMGLAFPGLSNPEKLHWGGQSGRFSSERRKNVYSLFPSIRNDEKTYGDFYMFDSDSQIETWTDPVDGQEYSGKEVAVWRFRRSMFNDFRARMDWCVAEYDQANHNPIAGVNGDTSNAIIHLEAKAGATINLDASSTTDPDGDSFSLLWWNYVEAGTYADEVILSSSTSESISVTIPQDAAGTEIHIILEVQDHSEIVPMYDFRRIVVSVSG